MDSAAVPAWLSAPLLIVDDVPDLLSLLVGQLERRGVSARVCSTVEEAVAALSEGRLAAAVVDLYFGPAPAGLGLLDAIRGHPEAGGMPVVSMSGSSVKEMEACLRHGADAVISKPFTVPELFEVLNTARRRRGEESGGTRPS